MWFTKSFTKFIKLNVLFNHVSLFEYIVLGVYEPQDKYNKVEEK